MQQRASYLRSLEDGARRACSSNPLSLPHSEIDKLAVACAECGYLRRRRTIPLMHTVHFHRIFNFFRNIFRNAVFDCFRSARKVSVYKAFLRFCDLCARKFSRSPRYDRFAYLPRGLTSSLWLARGVGIFAMGERSCLIHSVHFL